MPPNRTIDPIKSAKQAFGVPERPGPTLEADAQLKSLYGVSPQADTTKTSTPATPTAEPAPAEDKLASAFSPSEDIARSEGYAAGLKASGTFETGGNATPQPKTFDQMTPQEKEAEIKKTGRPYRLNENGQYVFQDTGEVFTGQAQVSEAGQKDTTGDALSKLFGVEAGTPQADALKILFGAGGIPEAPKTDTSALDKKIAEKGSKLDKSEQIRENLQSSLDATVQKYQLEREQARTDAENARNQQISGLSKLGFVNPLSSGVASIGTASADYLDKRIRNIDAQETLEKSILRKEAFDEETSADKAALDFLKEERQRIDDNAQQEYENMRTKFQDKVDAINAVRSLVESGQKASQDAIDRAQSSVFDMVKEFGSGVFDGMTDKAFSELETTAGFPEGTLKKGLQDLKEMELKQAKADSKPELRTIPGQGLFYITYDENSVPQANLLIKQSGGSIKSGTYFTQPNPDTGDIEYLFGDKNKPDQAQRLTQEQYLKGTSKAEGVLTDTGEEFLTRDYFKNLLTTDQLKKAAADEGFKAGGFLGIGVGDQGVNDYLDYLEETIKSYREAGYSDKEILDMMQS